MKSAMPNRRSFLRGAGVCLALPFLESLGAAAPKSGTAQRLVAINVPLGFHSPNFFPAETGVDYAMSPYLEIAKPLRKDFTVISGTSHPGVDGGHSAVASFLTGAPHPAARGFKNSISLDQVVAGEVGDATRFSSLSLGATNLSYTANGVAVPAIYTPRDLFSRLFITGSKNAIEKQKSQLDDGRSILDVVLGEAQSASAQASPLDREKLDQYLTAVRETEVRLTKSKKWLNTPKPKVDAEQPEKTTAQDLINWFKGHLDVTRLALQTDSTRVVALGGTDHGNVVPLPGVSMGYHALTHHGKNPDMIKQLEVIDRETIRVWAEFLSDLKSTPDPLAGDGGGTLLDHTQVLMGSNLGNASGHITTNLPILLAGGSHRHGQHLAFDKADNQPLARLFLSMLEGMGLEHDSFATAKSTMTGL